MEHRRRLKINDAAIDQDANHLPSSLSASDWDAWKNLKAAERERVRIRLAVLPRLISGELTAVQAAEICSVKRSRIYAMLAAWRANPSLEALGVTRGSGGAKKKSRLDPRAVNALQAVLPRIVRLNTGAPVTELIRLMVDTADLGGARLPGVTKLRDMVEQELRRAAATGEAGRHVRFDCCAVNLAQPSGRPWILCACIDKNAGAILGAALLDEPDICRGYALAARHALQRVETSLAALPWSPRLTNLEMIAGPDEAAAIALCDKLRNKGVTQSQLRRRKPRYGLYMRETIGPRLGPIALTPERTETGAAAVNEGATPWLLADAQEFLESHIGRHDEQVLPNAPPSCSAPPAELLMALRTLEAVSAAAAT